MQIILKKLASLPLTIESWIVSALGIIFIRIFLEHYSSNEASRFVLVDASTIIHYISFFMAVLLLSTFILMFFAKISLRESASIALVGFMIIWFPPVFDIITSFGNGYTMHYLFLQPKELLGAFITMFWSTTSHGITFGIRTEILIVTFATLLAVYSYTKSMARSVAASVLMYSAIFALVSLPSVIGLFQDASISRFIESGIMDSRIIANSTYPTQFGYERLIDVGFNSLMTQINLFIALWASFLIGFFGYKEKFKVLVRNSRPERIAHYSILIIVGSLFGGGPVFFDSWVNIISLATVIISFVFAWLVAVCINDIHDKEIDEVSNNDRPIPQGLFSIQEFYSFSIIFSLIAFVAAYSASMYGLFFVIIFSVAYYLYSAGPIKLKRHFVPGSLVIGLASLSALLSGFFLSNMSKAFLSFKPGHALFVVLLFGIGSMVKDLKDYDGDKLAGMKTLPVLLGLRRSKYTIASLLTIAFLWVSLYFRVPVLVISGIIASALIWKFILAKTYKENRFFAVYLSYLVVFIVVFVTR